MTVPQLDDRPDLIVPTMGKRQAPNLMERIADRGNLRRAFERVRDRGGAAGSDGQSVAVFDALADHELGRLRDELIKGRYRPRPMLPVSVPKRDDPTASRVLSVPTVRDRVCQHAILAVLQPLFLPYFDDASFGYRKGLGVGDAIRHARTSIAESGHWIVDADIRSFFDSVRHDVLLPMLAQQVRERPVLLLIQRCVAAPVRGVRRRRRRGLPQGGPLSPFLANVVLTPFDRGMRREGLRLTRYADDWVVTCPSLVAAERALAIARRLLDQLGLEVHPRKTRIRHLKEGFEFLGFRFRGPTSLHVTPTPRAVRRLRKAVRGVLRSAPSTALEDLARELDDILRGFGEAYRAGDVDGLYAKLDRWIAGRVWRVDMARPWVTGWWTAPHQVLLDRGLTSLSQIRQRRRNRRQS